MNHSFCVPRWYPGVPSSPPPAHSPTREYRAIKVSLPRWRAPSSHDARQALRGTRQCPVGVNPLAFPPRCDPPAGLEIPPCSDQSPRGKDPKDITRRLGLGEAPRAATPSPLLTASLRCLGGRHRVFLNPNVAFLQRPFGPKSAWQWFGLVWWAFLLTRV